jgi:DNA replication and repair protein RecF
MRLLSARLENFRNLAAAELEFSPHFTALIGPNGQGKTNTLEALYSVAALRPLRNVQRRALIRAGETKARVDVKVERSDTGLTHALGMEVEARSRQLQKDDKNCDAGAFIGTFVAVAFTPDDLSLGKGSPDGRRRFLDRALLDLRPSYLQRALRYQKAIKDRNRLLADEGSDETLDAFDQVIASEGAAISVARAQYIEEVAPKIVRHFERIAQPAPPLRIRYDSSLEDALDLTSEIQTRDAFLQRLFERRGSDRRRKTTSIGPHLDDLRFSLDGTAIKERASQGQHRAIVLALKLAELTHLTDRLGEPPVLLLDDMSSELDAERSEQLFRSVSQLEGQVVLTSTQPPALTARVYRVENGALFLA